MAQEVVAGARRARRVASRRCPSIADTFMGLILKQVRSLGVDTLKQTVMKLGSVHDRMWRGSGSAVIELGPKHLLIELLRGLGRAPRARNAR